MEIKPIQWQDGKLIMLDQTKLPLEELYLELTDYSQVVEAIKTMRVRGAPAIGIAAAYGLVLGAQAIEAKSKSDFLIKLDTISQEMAANRPTGIHLPQILDRMKQAAREGSDISEIKTILLEQAKRTQQKTEEIDRKISQLGAELIEDGYTILTHCNAGALATAGYGAAMNMIGEAYAQGKRIKVLADETRPLLQGSRLTAWELMQAGVPVNVITDNMAGQFMRRGKIDCVVVGADRIAANGDVANKIGTYSVAVLARENSVPFYVTASISTVDLSLKSGDEIPIEERETEEITHIQGVRIAPEGVGVGNPAFDITPHQYVTAIITERGIVGEPCKERLSNLFGTIAPSYP